MERFNSVEKTQIVSCYANCKISRIANQPPTIVSEKFCALLLFLFSSPIRLLFYSIPSDSLSQYFCAERFPESPHISTCSIFLFTSDFCQHEVRVRSRKRRSYEQQLGGGFPCAKLDREDLIAGETIRGPGKQVNQVNHVSPLIRSKLG